MKASTLSVEKIISDKTSRHYNCMKVYHCIITVNPSRQSILMRMSAVSQLLTDADAIYVSECILVTLILTQTDYT